MIEGLRIQIRGTVQGVGFRPWATPPRAPRRRRSPWGGPATGAVIAATGIVVAAVGI